MNRAFLILALASGLAARVLAPPAAAADAARAVPEGVTIAQAVSEALEHNLRLLAERYSVSIADARILTARLRPNPVVSFGADYQDVLGSGFSDKASSGAGPPEVNFRVDYVLERGGKRRDRIEVAATSREVAQLEVLSATRSLVLDVQNAFVEVLQARENLALAQENLKVFQGIVAVNSDRVRAGDLGKVELVRTQVAALQFRNSVRQAELRLRTARNRLQTLMGRAAFSESFDAVGDLRRDPTVPAAETLLQQAFEMRPDLQALTRDQARSVADLRLQIAQGKVDYTVGTMYHHQYGYASGDAMGFFFSAPLPVFNRNQGEIERVRQEQRQIEARIRALQFTPMAFTVCYALLGSMLLALTLIPVLATYLFRKDTKAWENPVLAWLQQRYATFLGRALQRPGLVLGVASTAVAASFVLAAYLGSEFLPQLDEGVLWVRANFPAGISLAKSAEMAGQIRSLLRESPEVKAVSSQTGRNDSGTDPYGPNRNEFFVALNPYDTWSKGKLKADLVEELSRKLRTRIPGAAFSFTQPIIDNVTEAVTGSAADLAVIISGPDLVRLREFGQQTLGLLERVPGAADTAIEQEADQAQLRILINRAELARYGINVRDVQDVIEMAIGGRAVSTKFEEERRFDVTVRYVAEARTDPTAIGNILIPTREGGRVPLSQLADLRIVNGATIIARRENRRQITVRTNIRGRDQGSFVADAQRLFDREVKLPAGYQVTWGGQFENLDRARRRLAFILPITVALIFTLLFFTFGSAGYAGLVLLNVPFSLVGGIVLLYLRGIHLNVSAAVGFISLFGVAVMSGVLVVAEIHRRRTEPGVPLEDAVLQGALAQMRPVLMMVVVALLGMVPAARATGIGSDVQRPLATVVVGGLLSTLFLTLLALPTLYYLVAGRSRKTAP